MSNLEEEYIRDKKYIHDTLEHNREHTNRLHGKFEDFKLEVTKSIAVIQTKLAVYVAAASVISGLLVNYLGKIIGVK